MHLIILDLLEYLAGVVRFDDNQSAGVQQVWLRRQVADNDFWSKVALIREDLDAPEEIYSVEDIASMIPMQGSIEEKIARLHAKIVAARAVEAEELRKARGCQRGLVTDQ